MTTPEKIGKYIVESELGHGGMAVVYLARDPNLGRLVAIKVILPDKSTDAREYLNRFQNEAKVVATLNHPAIVPIHDYDLHEGQPYLVMQYMSGGSLADRLQQGPLSLTEAAQILERIAPALDKVHQKNYIHRDLKPSNILFDDEGRPYLADFGLVKSVSEGSTAMTKDGLAMGTQAYMSPEQAMGQELDGRSDIYTLGVILFEMLTGQRPYQATPSAGVALAVKHVVEPVPNILEFKGDLPLDSQKLINQAMAKKKDERFSSGRALAKEVALLARGQGNQDGAAVFTPKKTTKTDASPMKSQWRPLLWLSLVGAGLLVAVIIFLVWNLVGDNILAVLATPTATITITPSTTPEPTTTSTSLPTTTNTRTPSQTPAPSFTATATFTPPPTVATPTIAPTLTTSATRRPNTATPTRVVLTSTPVPPTSAPIVPTNPPA
ncbi:MAG: serine/threonine protein kinase, partial [Chloroflexi bacterium]|nr:serine/threonine protein kinase [Chloroflexota bacterium]